MMFRQLLAAAAFTTLVSAHMQLFYPPPLKGYNNPHTDVPDDELLYPYNCCGKETPLVCRGHLSLLGTPEGASVAEWAAGSQQKWSLVGPAPLGGNHYGGSCQISFSIDKGETFRTVVSYEGNCPHRNGGQVASGQEFPFTVPEDLPQGDVVFAWTWNNREQEFFMNCAVVTITGGLSSAVSSGASVSESIVISIEASSSNTEAALPTRSASSNLEEAPSATASTRCRYHSSGSRCRKKRDHPLLDAAMKYKRGPGEKTQRFVQRAADVAFSSRPTILFSDIRNGCLTPKTTAELKYPNPGPNVIEGDGEYPVQLPTGNCS